MAKTLTIKSAKKLLAKRPAKLLCYGDSGTGKTLSSLLIAKYLCSKEGSVIVEDNENNTSALYSKDNYGLDFYIAENEPPYDIAELPARIEALAEAAGEGGVVIIDSLSAYWSGTGGALSTVNKWTGGNQKENQAAWGRMAPLTTAVGEAIRHCPVHLICTAKSSGEDIVRDYINPKTGRPGKKRERVSTTAKMKQDWLYEFDAAFLHQQRLKEDGTRVITIVNDKPPRILELTDKQYSIGSVYEEGYVIWDAEEVASIISHGVKQEAAMAERLKQQRQTLADLLVKYKTTTGSSHELGDGIEVSTLSLEEVNRIGKQVYEDLQKVMQAS